ncbi:hypothetical protein CRUP_009131 [Coryphaenoides rupestris]|nr:hypothetical protein CRUP_009131 [Coryphaenoides rupestris]
MADEAFQNEFLATHNTYRTMHQSPPLSMNGDLSKAAQQWADHLLALDKLEHSQGSYGENLFFSFSSAGIHLTGKEAVDSWYGEIKDYDFSSPGFSGSTGHFTQVVWKASTEVGVGVATDGNKVYVVGQYTPAGNISNPGYFQENVLPQV